MKQSPVEDRIDKLIYRARVAIKDMERTMKQSPKSKCCGSDVRIGGDDVEGTHYYICETCSRACDLRVEQSPTEDTEIISPYLKGGDSSNTATYKNIEPEQSPKEDWKKLKHQLMSVQKEFEDRNGLPYCKNCGVSFDELVYDIESILDSRDKEWLDKVKSLKMEEKPPYKATEIPPQGDFYQRVGFNSCVSEVNKRIDLILEEK